MSSFDEKETTDRPRPRAHEHQYILLMLMIKNESRIIERCLEHALPHVDAVSILDTGSTDDTVERSRAFLTSRNIPHRIETEPFKNFGHNRTISFQVAQRLCQSLKWDATQTYALAVDADMVIRPQPSFRTTPLTINGYSVIQENGHLKYYNMRLMRCSYPWVCVGATHEYWSGDPTGKLLYDVFHIDDKNDGGCKSDKFERDVRLLTEDIQADPTNGRSYYYLGQSLKDLGKFTEAIPMFKKRIQLGGWYEEVWYAHYQIGRCYDHMKDEHQMERWMNKAFLYHSKRSEPLYHLTKYFRETSQHYKSYHYYLKGKDIPYPKDDMLFIEEDVYTGLFDYENTILSCYVRPFPHEKLESQLEIIRYMNRWSHHHQNVFDNLVFYVSPLTGPIYEGTYRTFSLPHHTPGEIQDEYQASSCSLVPYLSSATASTSSTSSTASTASSSTASTSTASSSFLLNARYVNYRIDERGCYHMRSPDGHVKTKNAIVRLSEEYHTKGLPRFLEEDYKAYDSHIEGLEDIRLFYHQGVLRFTASSKNITPTGKVVIVYGTYDVGTETGKSQATHLQVLEPPRPSDCEKNWIYVPNEYLSSIPESTGRLNFLFGWHPLQIGSIHEEQTETYQGKLHIHTVQTTPRFFSHLRGSTPLVPYQGKLYAVAHHVKYCTPRNYLHILVQFSSEMKVERYTPMFCFRKTAIEYCIGFHIKNETATFVFSENDAHPGMIQVPWKKFRWVEV